MLFRSWSICERRTAIPFSRDQLVRCACISSARGLPAPPPCVSSTEAPTWQPCRATSGKKPRCLPSSRTATPSLISCQLLLAPPDSTDYSAASICDLGGISCMMWLLLEWTIRNWSSWFALKHRFGPYLIRGQNKLFLSKVSQCSMLIYLL